MRTLHVRMPVICSNAATVAARLEQHPAMSVLGARGHPDHLRSDQPAARFMPSSSSRFQKTFVRDCSGRAHVGIKTWRTCGDIASLG